MTTAHLITHRVTLNSGWLFASRLISQGLSALTLIALARSLGAEGLGRYAFVTSVIVIANTLTTFGTDTLIIREVAHDPKSTVAARWPAAAMAIQAALSLIFITIIWILPGQMAAMRLYSLALM